MTRMLDWLNSELQESANLEIGLLLKRLSAAFVMGCVVAAVYRLTTRSGHGPSFLGTLVLLSVLIAMLTLVIGNSPARAFTLVGALAIVRFRTVVEDTRDTAFVIFAVSSGMCCGAGSLLVPIVGTPLVLLGAWLFRPRKGAAKEFEQTLVLRVGTASGAEQRVQALLKERLPGYHLAGLETVRGGTALDIKFAIPPLTPEAALALAAELNGIEGVQGVELKGG
jgi:hypothetical protein